MSQSGDLKRLMASSTIALLSPHCLAWLHGALPGTLWPDCQGRQPALLRVRALLVAS
jgi:hypothetical protein